MGGEELEDEVGEEGVEGESLEEAGCCGEGVFG